MRVLVTRPEPEAARWVAGLRARGWEAQVLPLIAIRAAPDAAALQAARRGVGDWNALMFVSANAVRAFFAADANVDWPAAVRAWAPGEATAAALREVGVPADRIAAPAADAAQWDSEHLWPRVAAGVGPGFRLLLVRGAGEDGRPAGRDWLGDQVAAAGGEVASVAAYRREVPVWDADQRALAASARGGDARWLFSSSEAVRNLATLAPGSDWSAATAVATHPRIADAATRVGFGRVLRSAPSLDAVVASIESTR